MEERRGWREVIGTEVNAVDRMESISFARVGKPRDVEGLVGEVCWRDETRYSRCAIRSCAEPI